MKKFIYVFDVEAKNTLVEAGFKLITENLNSSIFVFLGNKSLCFSLDKEKYVYSNILSF